MESEIIQIEPMLTKQESEFWAWKGIVERTPSDFKHAFDLEGQGCPKYLIRAMLDLIQETMKLTKEQEDFVFEQGREEAQELNIINSEDGC